MLSVLRVKNLVIVEELELEFSAGLNAITGETGAGKSIVLKAIGLITGARANTDTIRPGADRCEVEGLFVIDESLKAEFLRADLMQDIFEGDQLLIRRVIDSKGSGKIYANGVLITLGMLQKIGAVLVEVTNQHEQRNLLSVESHGEFLDSYAGLGDLVAENANAYREYITANRAWEEFVRDSQEQAELIRRLRFEEEEFAAIQPEVGELDRLEEEEKRFSYVERLLQLSAQVSEIMDSDDAGIGTSLNRVDSLLSEAAKYDKRFLEAAEFIGNASAQIAEARFTLDRLASSLDTEPDRLEYLRERISQLKSLQRKYRKDLGELVNYWAEIRGRLAKLDGGNGGEEFLRKQKDDRLGSLRLLEERLSQARKKFATKFAKAVETELGALEMKQVRFQVQVTSANSSLRGADRVEFLIAPNPGAGFSQLSKTASGGELSRVLLVIKTLVGADSRPRLQIFDEVDTGVSGAVAQVVGEKLARVSVASQVLVVTHSPQVAAMAARHFSLIKAVSGKSTKVRAEVLSENQRVKELARMLAGRKVTANFEDSAKELLAHRQSYEVVNGCN